MDVRMFSLAVRNTDEIRRMSMALSKLSGVQDVMERSTRGDIIVTYDADKLSIGQIMNACQPQFAILDRQRVYPRQQPVAQ